MSFFQDARNIDISGNPQFNHVQGNFNQWNDNRHVHNVNSNNRTMTTNTNSHNNNSVWQGSYPQNIPSARSRANQRANERGRGRAFTPQSRGDRYPDAYDDDSQMPRWPANPASSGHTRNIGSYNTTTENNWDSFNDNSRTFGPQEFRPPRIPNQASTSRRNPPRGDPMPPTPPHVYGERLRPPTLGEHHVKSNPDIPLYTGSQSGSLSPPILVHSASATSRPTEATFRPASPFNEPFRTELPPPPLAVPSASQSHSSASTPSASPSPSSISPNVESDTEQPRPPTSSNAPTHLQALLLSEPLPAQQRTITAGILATQRRIEAQETIRIKLAKVSLSGMEDSSFFLKGLAESASRILTTVETIIEGDIDKGFIDLALESHAVTFVAIILCERRLSERSNFAEKKNIKSLNQILDDIYALVVKLRGRGSLKKMLTHMKDTRHVQQFRTKLVAWLRVFENDTEADILDSLKRVLAENQVRRGTPLSGTSNNLISRSTPAPSSTHISNIEKSALALGSGSAAVINGGTGNRKIVQNSYNKSTVNYHPSTPRQR